MTRTLTRHPHPALSAEERDAVLARDVPAVLAFVDGNGFPRMVPCWYLWDSRAFYVTSERDKFHVRCLRRNDRASICVDIEDVVAGEHRSNRQVKAVGRVNIFDDDPGGSYWRRIRARYLGSASLPDDITLPNDRVVIALEPERLTAHGGDLVLKEPRRHGR